MRFPICIAVNYEDKPVELVQCANSDDYAVQINILVSQPNVVSFVEFEYLRVHILYDSVWLFICPCKMG